MSRAQFPVVVHVVLQRQSPERQVFLLRRANTGFLDGYFALPGGHAQSGELPMEAALRECQEETGVTPTQLEPLCVMPYRAGAQTGINCVFAAGGFTGVARLAEPAFSDLAVWVEPTALPEPCPLWLPELLARPDRWYMEFERPGPARATDHGSDAP